MVYALYLGTWTFRHLGRRSRVLYVNCVLLTSINRKSFLAFDKNEHKISCISQLSNIECIGDWKVIHRVLRVCSLIETIDLGITSGIRANLVSISGQIRVFWGNRSLFIAIGWEIGWKTW